MNLTTLVSEKDNFTLYTEKSLIPEICERFENGENKLEYTYNEILEVLHTNNTMENLYLKLRLKLVDYSIGTSIKRTNNKFVFFRKSDNIKRDTDLFGVKFKEKFMPIIIRYLDKHLKMVISEKLLKDYMECNEDTTDNLYAKLRKQLIYDNINVSIERNVLVKNSKMDIFIFYYKDSEKKIIEQEHKEKEEFFRIEKEQKEESVIEQENYNKMCIERDNITNQIEEKEKLKNKNILIEEGSKLINSIMNNSNITNITNSTKNIAENAEIFHCPSCNKTLKNFENKCTNCGLSIKWVEN